MLEGLRWEVGSEDVITEEITADPISYPTIKETLRILLLPIVNVTPFTTEIPPTYKRVWTVTKPDSNGPALYSWEDHGDDTTVAIDGPALWVKIDIMFTGRRMHQEASLVDEDGPIVIDGQTVAA